MTKWIDPEEPISCTPRPTTTRGVCDRRPQPDLVIPNHSDQLDAPRDDVASADYANVGHPLRRLAAPFVVGVRTKFYRAFETSMAPTPDDRVLDVGVTPDTSMEDSNFFERSYPYTSQITATSIEDASLLEKRFPGLQFVKSDGRRLPFEDNEFDIAYSSAVIEHTGTREEQRQFLSELIRVSKRYFITTPNRWFPLELHSFLPFVHWLPQKQHQRILRRLGHEQWASTDTLNLLDESSLRSLFPPGVTPTCVAVRAFGLRSHVVAYGPSSP